MNTSLKSQSKENKVAVYTFFYRYMSSEGGKGSPVAGVLDLPYGQLTPLSGVAVQARQST
jgi:hypothetical protein